MRGRLIDIAKAVLKRSPVALSQNHGYDLQTRRILARCLRPDSNCVDVGCHKGEILALMLRHAPRGRHWGFEPIPALYAGLQRTYGQRDNVTILPIALADRRGTTHFNHVITNPSYSGIERRTYDRPHERDERIEVAVDRLDDVIPPDVRIDLIKVDVEGAELGVLLGARHILARDRPLVIFEHGLGGSDHYGTTPAAVYGVFAQAGLEVWTLRGWLRTDPALAAEDFTALYLGRAEYYFVGGLGSGATV